MTQGQHLCTHDVEIDRLRQAFELAQPVIRLAHPRPWQDWLVTRRGWRIRLHEHGAGRLRQTPAHAIDEGTAFLPLLRDILPDTGSAHDSRWFSSGSKSLMGPCGITVEIACL